MNTEFVMAIEELIRKLTDLKSLSPKPSKDEEDKFKSFLEKEGRASLCDVTFETDETFSVASSSTTVNHQKNEESKKNRVVAIQSLERPGMGRGYRFGRREESKTSSIVDDLQNFLSKM